MKISGFSMVKNAGKLFYPLKESISSILPLVDEYVIAVGDNDADDTTLEIIENIQSEKIKIIRTRWDIATYPGGSILAQQTDEAKKHCTGDWLLYLQADEIIHEKDHAAIRQRCEDLLEEKEVEGLLFRYIHFWGDYDHAFTGNHFFYRNEIRLIRNRPDIHSWGDAQSFKVMPEFTKEKYLEKKGTRKLQVARVDAHIYHYGWVRPPKLMGKKQSHFNHCYENENKSSDELAVISEIDFGPLGTVPMFNGTHPKVMDDLRSAFNWGDELDYGNTYVDGIIFNKHNRFKYRFLSWLENRFFKDGLFTFKNYKLVR
jgi:hypothetical protein